jgi:predicted dehydrogenase
LKIAVVGAGPAGQAHAFGFRNATMADSLAGVTVELDTIVDPDTELAEIVARRYGFRRVAADVQDVIADPGIDAVSVALPNFLSLPVLGALLRAGKHVIGEKPLGRNGAEAGELVEIAKETGLVAGVGFSYRRVPALAQLRKAVRDGAIGTPYFARARYLSNYALDPASPMTWRFDIGPSGGGTSLDMAPHAIDLLQHVVADITAVTSCSLRTVIAERPTRDGGTAQVTNDDTALIDVQFAGGAIGSVLASRVAAGCPNDLGIEVYGSNGHAKWSVARQNEWVLYQSGVGDPDQDAPRTIIAPASAPYFLDTMPMVFRGNATGYGEAFVAEMQEFLRCVVAGTEMDTSFAAAASTMRVVDAALTAATTGQATAVAKEA